MFGVAAMVLAASGETIWHVNAAAAGKNLPLSMAETAAGEAIALNAAGAAAESSTVESTEAESRAAMFTGGPIFKPFVMVHIELPDGYTSGEVMDVNDAGQAVGWMHYDGDDTERAFFFDPATAFDETTHGVTMLDFTPSYDDSTWAFALTNDSPPSIAGAVMWKGSPMFLRACTWEGPTGDIDITFSYPIVSEAYAIATVSSTTTIAGRYEVSGQSRSVVHNGSPYYPASGIEGEARGINDSGEVVGWHTVSGDSHAYSWVSDTTTDIHPSAYDASGATAINDDGDVAGWVVDDPDGPIPAYWYNTGSNFYTFATPFPALGAESEVCDINNHGEMVITRTDEPGAAIWQVFDSEDVSFNLSGMTLMPDATGQIASAQAINDHLWIGGSYKATSQSQPQPCLIIPYDVDNDGDPDYREIVNGAEDDENENWLIDWAENMRVGINNPGYAVPGSNPAHAIENTRVVSLPLHIAFLPENLGEDEYSINGVLDEQCEDFRTAIEHWARATQADPQEREVSILLHSSLGDELGEDYLPGNGNEYDRAQLLTSIRKFAYQYAWCVDYVQTGNEVFGGAGGYRFYYDSELFGCNAWQGVRTFQQLDADCKEEAVILVRDWLGEQAWAALEGSALAGRPLRIIGPGIIHAHVLSAAEDPPGAVGLFIMEAIVPWLNDNQMYFDMHLHYRTIPDGLNAIDDLTDPNSNWGGPPNWKVSREFGPAATDGQGGWASGSNVTEYKKFRNDYTTQGPCGSNCCQEVPDAEHWDAFVLDNWRYNQFADDFEMDTFLAALEGEGWTFVAYGPVHQEAPPAMVFDVAALRANRICWEWMDQQNRSQTTRFTPLTDEFVAEAANFTLTFPQNRQGCPTCPQ